MAKLPSETSVIIDLLRNRCLAIIDLVMQAESKIFIAFDETEETLVVLSELKAVAQEAIDAYGRLNSLQLKVAMAQPEISASLAKLILDSRVRIEIRIPAWQRSIEEILLAWRLNE